MTEQLDSQPRIYMLCPSCGSQLPYQFKRCPHCGYSFSVEETSWFERFSQAAGRFVNQIGSLFCRMKPVSGREKKLYQNLLRKTRFDRELTERLIRYELEKDRAAGRVEAIKNAINRWERDNH